MVEELALLSQESLSLALLALWPEPWPQEVAQLFDIFRGVERALECYILKKRSIEHGKHLSRKFLKPSDKRGLGYGEMKEADAGEAMEMMCPTCLTPRDPEKKKCLFCKSTEEVVHYTQPMASMLVDGKLWELRFDADGTYHWEAEGVTQEEKDAAMVDVSSLAQSPSPSMDPSEASFAGRRRRTRTASKKPGSRTWHNRPVDRRWRLPST